MVMRDDAGDFFAARFRDLAPGELIEIRAFAGGRPVRDWFTDPAAATALTRRLATSHDVYHGVSARVGRLGTSEAVRRVRVLWADADDKRFSTGREGALAALAGFPLTPTWLVDSGGGLHAYWALEPAVPIAGPEDAARLAGLLRRLYARLGGLDAVHDLARLLRVPGSWNHKYTPSRPVTALDHDPGRRYSVAQFAELLPEPPAPSARPAGFASGNDRVGVPSPAEIAAMFRHIPPRGDYTDDWLRVLAAVHSVYPGPEGVALCEAWSPGQPGEVARKFASFGRYRGEHAPTGLGTLIYLARRGGWRPPRRPVLRVREVRHAGA